MFDIDVLIIQNNCLDLLALCSLTHSLSISFYHTLSLFKYIVDYILLKVLIIIPHIYIHINRSDYYIEYNP